MDGIEVGRVNVAARGYGVVHRAFELAVSYARSRRTFGKIIGEHQAVSFKLAEMATKTVAAHQMMVLAARRKDEGGQTDVEAGEYEIERLYRDAPMLLIGEGTSEIQKMIIGQRIVSAY
jgi:alkylation response protein AidB-like acyl-CoA dehydrogenase